MDHSLTVNLSMLAGTASSRVSHFHTTDDGTRIKNRNINKRTCPEAIAADPTHKSQLRA
jgi:hypothetical protein